MKQQNNSQRSDVTTLPIIPGTILIAAGILAAFLVMMAVLYSTQVLTPPAFLEGIFSREDGNTPDDGFSDAFISSLTGHAPLNDPSSEKFLDMSAETLRDLILNVTPPEKYYYSATVTWADGGERLTVAQVYYLVSGDKLHGEIYTATTTPKRLTAHADTFYIRENSTSRIFQRSEDSSFTPEGELGLPSLSRMQKMISEAADGKYTLTVESVQDSPCIRATFTDTISGVKEIFDVMPDYGIIVNAASYLPDRQSPYYSMQTSSILTDISGFDEAIFEIPTS